VDGARATRDTILTLLLLFALVQAVILAVVRHSFFQPAGAAAAADVVGLQPLRRTVVQAAAEAKAAASGAEARTERLVAACARLFPPQLRVDRPGVARMVELVRRVVETAASKKEENNKKKKKTGKDKENEEQIPLPVEALWQWCAMTVGVEQADLPAGIKNVFASLVTAAEEEAKTLAAGEDNRNRTQSVGQAQREKSDLSHTLLAARAQG
jgi:hypothetical protein